MALIIKADMPKGCGWDCDLWSEGLCAPLQKSVDEHTIDSDCPIIGEIPDKHGDLVDVQAIEERAKEIQYERGITYKEALLLAFDGASVIVEATE